MKRIIFCFSVCIAAITALAQTADVEISYNYKHFHRRGSEINDQMILLANASYSKFYNPVTEYLDSLEATPEGKEIYNRMKMAAFTSGKMGELPSRTVPMYVFKNKDGNIDVFDGNVISLYQYSETYEAQKWEIGDMSKEILGYDCISATTDYHGRHWTVWFAPDIPVQDGPWKLSGLPGLILEACEDSGEHHFVATGISSTKKEITPNLNKDNYEKTDRISMLKALHKYEDNPEAAIGLTLGISIKSNNNNKRNKSFDLLETDYK